ncbi:MAG: rRNA maturation RNase YbeY [Candidatus Omnitrophota bacterium]
MNKIKIKNLQKKTKINQKKLRSFAEKVLKNKGIDKTELSVLLVDNLKIKQLNEKYLGKNSATDVLAFRMADGDFNEIHPEILGDVIISLEMAKKCAKQLNSRWEEEVYLYLTHGILHLLGYSDLTEKGFNQMQEMQKEILEKCA